MLTALTWFAPARLYLLQEASGAAGISALQIIEDVGEVAFKFVPLLMQAQARR
jgi:hypothetical protein